MRFIPLFLLLISCATPAPIYISQAMGSSLDTFKIPADLEFSIDGVAYKGLAVVPHKAYREFKFTLPKDTERLFITTCHRRVRIFSPTTNPYVFVYQPRPLVENVGSCLMKVESLTKLGAIKSAVIDFTSEKENMEAYNTCDGVTIKTVGATLCQSPAGLKQMIQLSEGSDVVAREGCNPMECTGIYCYYLMNTGDCVYRAVGLKSGKVHRITTRGYQEQ